MNDTNTGATGAVRLDDHGGGSFSLVGSANFHNIGPLLFAGQGLFSGHDEIAIDLADARFASTAGLALLMEWSYWCQAKGISLMFDRPQDSLIELLSANDVQEILPTAN
jgi:ABC-type transporter Mla MlaB component